MKEVPTMEEKFDFITRNGWVVAGGYHQDNRVYRKKEWNDQTNKFLKQGGDIYQYPLAFRSCNLDAAYAMEMEAEYDRVIDLLLRAKDLITAFGGANDGPNVGAKWLEDYKTWSKT